MSEKRKEIFGMSVCKKSPQPWCASWWTEPIKYLHRPLPSRWISEEGGKLSQGGGCWKRHLAVCHIGTLPHPLEWEKRVPLNPFNLKLGWDCRSGPQPCTPDSHFEPHNWRGPAPANVSRSTEQLLTPQGETRQLLQLLKAAPVQRLCFMVERCHKWLQRPLNTSHSLSHMGWNAGSWGEGVSWQNSFTLGLLIYVLFYFVMLPSPELTAAYSHNHLPLLLSQQGLLIPSPIL